ncbi:Ctr copper transporter [Triangularia verruculosa]|uniref:Copper transport protein n=1 Tax=Triangularia verruculosa TaxID=2587418 RepID=A0AAN6XFL7_9PEZI|nr:Ctr copper transporter [Triangularia verruculosa]
MAATCIGVLLLAFFLEGLRRLTREYDRHLLRHHTRKNLPRGHADELLQLEREPVPPPPVGRRLTASSRPLTVEQARRESLYSGEAHEEGIGQVDGSCMSRPWRQREKSHVGGLGGEPYRRDKGVGYYRPSFWQQLLRALLHLVNFVLAYLLMLLGMYYNGFVLFSIFLGVFFGFLLFQWTRLGTHINERHARLEDRDDAVEDVTVCCG